MKIKLLPIFLLVLALFKTTTVSAGLIYHWQSVTGNPVFGQLEFSNNVNLGDTVTLADMSSFTFKIFLDVPYFPSYDLREGSSFSVENGLGVYSFDNTYMRDYAAMEVSSLGLCVPSCSSHSTAKSAAKKKAVKGSLYMDMFVPGVAKKKAVKKGSEIEEEVVVIDPLWNWDVFGLVSALPPTEPLIKVKGEFVDLSGSGRWALQGSEAIPEPSTLLTFLLAISCLSLLRRKLFKQKVSK